MPTPTASVKVNPLTGALIDPIAATFASANGFLTGGTSDAKESVVCATTANGTLATAFENGDTVDGIVLATGNRILIKNQSAPAENGIYTVNASGAPTRATDFDSWTEIVGAFVSVESGTVNAGTQWLCNVVSGGTLNTTAINFVVPQNYVNLTTNQTVGGNKYFSASSMMGGVGFSKDGVLPAVNAQLIFGEDDSVLGVLAAAGELVLRSTGITDVTFPLSGTLATTTGNVATATALATARNIFNISFNGTANVAGDATNTGHFASIPGTGAAGHFVTENGTAPTVIAGRSAWYSDGSGVPCFKNGSGAAVTLVRSSDLGTGIATFLITPSSANLAAAVTDETGTGALVFGTSPEISQIEVGHASDTTLARASAGVLSVEGIRIATIPDMYGEKFAILREEFASGTNSDGSIGELGWRTNNVGGTGGTGTYLVGTTDHPGIFTMTTAAAFVASVPDARGLILAGSAVCPFSSFVAGQEIRVTFQLSSVANVAMKIGLTNDNAVFAPNRGEYLSFDTSLGDTNFMGVTKDGGAETRTSTGVAATTGWFTVKIRYISTSSIGFSLSSAGGAYSSEITVAQTAGATQRFLCIYIANGAASAKTISVDFVGYYAALTR